jgi:hypothetical protein
MLIPIEELIKSAVVPINNNNINNNNNNINK